MPTALCRPEARQRGQAVVEYVAWAAFVAALGLALGAAAVAAGIPQAVAVSIGRALDDGGSDAGLRSADPQPATMALVVAAVHGSPQGRAPTIADAERLLAAEIGPDRARAEVERLAVVDFADTRGEHLEGVKEVVGYGALGARRPAFSGVGPPSEARWHGVQQRRLDARATAHVVTPEAAERLLEALHRRNTRELRLRLLQTVAIEAGLTTLVPLLRWPLFAAQLVQAVRTEERPSAFPPGLRADDLVLCYPVRRLNTFSSDRLRARWGAGPTALDMDRWHDMTHTVVVRSGVIVGEAMSDATTCV